MKIFKVFGCLTLLCVIICGCAVLGSKGKTNPSPETAPAVVVSETKSPELLGNDSGETAVTTPVYSEGLRFRSNGDGTCALSGIGSCTATCLLIPPVSPAGDTVTEILPFALRDSLVAAIEIPTTVTTLSAESFSGCQRLSYLRVASGNTAFIESGGALYSADGTLLIYYPAARGNEELVLKESVQRIAAGAFSACGSLKQVYYPGTVSAWHAVIVGDENAPLYAAGFRFKS